MHCWQIVIKDANNLSGESVEKLLKIIIARVKYIGITVCELEGSGITGLQKATEDGLVAARNFFDLVREVVQIDWGTFCLFYKDQALCETRVEMIAKSLAVVRCVDDQYFYVYTTNDVLASLISNKYKVESSKHIPIECVDWPS